MRISLGDGIFWIAVACCVVAQAAILRSVLITRTAAPQSDQVPRPRSGAEVAWAILPALALAGLLVLTWRTMHRQAPAYHVAAQVSLERAP
ncbi:MAG TPA: hypothetical protein VG818_00090 [Gemmatimonadaceae bacterium]|jgi:heme/copper-type cytochrome/quinol oxidase subunit 2|nr:hypothetical protein [Gemmatimonadaceae bacterium]